jgi:hypothetical protein
LKKLDFGQTIALAANLGVIAGIFFLGIELRQIQNQMDAEISFNRFSEENATRRMMATTPLLAAAAAKSNAGQELTPEEDVMLGSYVSSIIIGAEYAWRENQSGRVEEVGFQELARRIEVDFWGIAIVWNRMKQGALDPEFVATIDRLKSQPKAVEIGNQ